MKARTKLQSRPWTLGQDSDSSVQPWAQGLFDYWNSRCVLCGNDRWQMTQHIDLTLAYFSGFFNRHPKFGDRILRLARITALTSLIFVNRQIRHEGKESTLPKHSNLKHVVTSGDSLPCARK
jgi:hypothetical protein